MYHISMVKTSVGFKLDQIPFSLRNDEEKKNGLAMRDYIRRRVDNIKIEVLLIRLLLLLFLLCIESINCKACC